MCRTFPDAADLFSGVNALCRYGIYRQSSTSENAVFVEIQQRCIEVRRLSPGTESDPNKSLDDIFKTVKVLRYSTQRDSQYHVTMTAAAFLNANSRSFDISSRE